MINKYKYTDKERDQLLKSIVLIIDSAEKEGKHDHILSWLDEKGIKYIKRSLDQGDYTFYLPKNDELNIPRDLFFDHEIVIERKNSLTELSGNFTTNRERFEKELTFAPKHKYLLIENASYHDIPEGNYDTEYKAKSYLATLHTFMDRYDLPVMFMPKEEYSAMYIYYTFYYYLKNILH